MARNMSQAEIDRRKKLQAVTSRVGGTLGLTSLGAFALSTKSRGKAFKVVPVLSKPKRKAAGRVALGTSTAGAGLGGVGSFNFASYTAAEARQRKKKQGSIKKSAFGIEH